MRFVGNEVAGLTPLVRPGHEIV